VTRNENSCVSSLEEREDSKGEYSPLPTEYINNEVLLNRGVNSPQRQRGHKEKRLSIVRRIIE